MTRKERKIIIRCGEETWRRFRLLTAKMGFRNSEQMLEWLLTKAEKEWLPEKVY